MPNEPSEKAKAAARELAELADETLTSEGDPIKYEAEMETLRSLFAPLLDSFAGEAQREEREAERAHCATTVAEAALSRAAERLERGNDAKG